MDEQTTDLQRAWAPACDEGCDDSVRSATWAAPWLNEVMVGFEINADQPGSLRAVASNAWLTTVPYPVYDECRCDVLADAEDTTLRAEVIDSAGNVLARGAMNAESKLLVSFLASPGPMRVRIFADDSVGGRLYRLTIRTVFREKGCVCSGL